MSEERLEAILKQFEQNHLKHIQDGVNRIDKKLDSHLSNYDRFKDETRDRHAQNAQDIVALKASGTSNMGWVKSILLLVLGPIIGAAITFFTLSN